MFNRISQRVYQKRKVNLKTALGFGLTDFMGGGGQAVIGAWLLFFYTSYCNLSATQSALIMSAGQIVSGICGLIIGGISDNFYHTRLGKKFGRRHFFLYASAPLMFTFTLIWIGGQSFWYYLFIYCAYSSVSMVMIPYETLPTEMTNKYDERTKLSTARLFFSSIAGTLATFIPGQLFKIMGTNTETPFLVNGLLFGIIFCLALLITAWSTWELPLNKINVHSSDLEKKKIDSLKDTIKGYCDFFKVRSCRQHFGIYLCSFSGRDLVNMVFTFFCLYCLHLSATQAANLMSLSIFGIIITILGGYLFMHFKPKYLYEVAYLLILISIFSFYFVYQLHLNNPFLVMFFIVLLYQISSSLLGFVPWQVYAFLPDIDEIVSGENRAGSLASLINLLRNSTSAITTMLVGMYLDKSNFVKGAQEQSATAQGAIIKVMMMGAVLIIIAGIIAKNFDLNKETHRIIVKEIQRLRGGGQKKDASDKTKNIVKRLTGYNYKNIWQIKN